MTGEDAEGRAGEERHLEAPMSAHRSKIGKSVDGRHEVQQRLPLTQAQARWNASSKIGIAA